MKPEVLAHPSLTILVVDDIASAREQLVHMVRELGYRCFSTSSGAEALQVIELHDPDVVLLDLLMPSMDGFEISATIRDQVTHKWLPVIAVSSLQGDEHFIHALSMGAADYLVKPVRAALLRAKLEHYQKVLALQHRGNKAAQLKDEFLTTVSHELRTPITSVVGAMGLLISGSVGPLPPAALELAKIAKRNGDRLNRLINDVLDLAKLESNHLEFNQKQNCLNELTRDAIESTTFYGQRLGVDIRLTEAPSKAPCNVDADRFLQVMANLLSNAIKHYPPSKVVSVRLTESDDCWRIQVIDQGVGIDPAFQARMFEKFSQAQSSERRYAGSTGLGLYISRMLVERMGGSISALSEPGKGSVFSVQLPKGGTHD